MRVIYLVLSLRSISRLCNPLLHGQGIPWLSTYTTSLHRPTVHLRSHKVVTLPGILIRTLTSSTDVDTNQTSWTHTGTDQNSPKYVGLGPNISNMRSSIVNNIFLLLHLLLQCRDWSQPIRSPTKYLQQTSGLRQYLSGFEHLTRNTPRLCPIFSNKRRGPTNFIQLPLQPDELFSTDARALEPDAVTSYEAVWNVDSRWSSDTLVRGFLHH